MYDLLAKRGQLLAFLVGAVVTIIFLISVLTGLPDGFNQMAASEQHQVSVFNFGISAAVALIILAAALMLLFGIYHTFTNLRASLKALIGLGVLVVLFLIAYSMSSTACAEVDAGVCKAIGGGITVALVLIAVAFIGFLLSELINLFR